MIGSTKAPAGMEIIGELPKSDKPWEFSTHCGIIIACNPDHPPHVIDGKEIRSLEVTRGDLRFSFF